MKRTVLLLFLSGSLQAAPDNFVVTANFPNSGTGWPPKQIAINYSVKITNSSGSARTYRLTYAPPVSYISGDNSITLNSLTQVSGNVNSGSTQTFSGVMTVYINGADPASGMPVGAFDDWFPLEFAVTRRYLGSQFSRHTIIATAEGGIRCTGNRITTSSASPDASVTGSFNWEFFDTGVERTHFLSKASIHASSGSGFGYVNSSDHVGDAFYSFAGSSSVFSFPGIIGSTYAPNGSVLSGPSTYTVQADGNPLWDFTATDLGSSGSSEEVDWSVLSVQVEFLAYSVFGSAAAAAVVLAFKNLCPA